MMYAVLLDMIAHTRQSNTSSVLRPGTVLHGTVRPAENGLAAVAKSLSVPLPDTAGLAPHQPVVIEVRETPQGLQLQIRPAPAPQAAEAASQAAPRAALARLVEQTLQLINLNSSPQTAADALPAMIPQSSGALGEFFGMYSAPNDSFGSDLQKLAAMLEHAPAAADEVRQTILSLIARADEPVAPVLKALVRDALPPEARLSQDALGKDLQTLLTRLRNDPAFDKFLRDTGQRAGFETLADRIVTRLAQANVQNLRSLDQPYVFFQVPMAAESAIRRANIHIVSNGKKGAAFDPDNTAVAFDISTEKLGDLWVTLALTCGRCSCRICATTDAALAALRDATDELRSSLTAAGYPNAAVHAVLWDGDRIGQAAAFVRPFAGLDVEA